jgi:hypothetical protein
MSCTKSCQLLTPVNGRSFPRFARGLTRAAFFVGAVLFLAPSTARAASLAFSTAVNHSSSTTNQMRSLAYGNSSVYIGYIQTTGGDNRRLVDRHDDVVPAGAPLNTLTYPASDQPKAIAIDDRGNVFIGTRNSGDTSSNLSSYTSTFGSPSSLAVGSPNIGGLHAVTLGGVHYVYASYEGSGLIQRFNVENTGAMVADTTFNAGSSTYTVAGASTSVLRGLTVGSDGTIYVTSRADNKIYKIDPTLTTVTSATVTAAQDVALYQNSLYISSYNGTSSLVRQLSAGSLSLIQDFNAGTSTLDGNPYARAAGGGQGWAGIDIDPTGRLWLADQQYGVSGGLTFDRLITAQVPEPSTIVLAGLGLAAAAFYWRRRRR